jgi:hypothetical protein
MATSSNSWELLLQISDALRGLRYSQAHPALGGEGIAGITLLGSVSTCLALGIKGPLDGWVVQARNGFA